MFTDVKMTDGITKSAATIRGFSKRASTAAALSALRIMVKRYRSTPELPNTQADARIRTGDPFITSEVLYQLSYVG